MFTVNGKHLHKDIVLLDYIYPVLFTCLDEDGDMYIVSCYWADGNTKEWLIAESTPARVISLLQDSLSMQEIFLNVPLYQAILKKGEEAPAVIRVHAEDVDQRNLPTADEYMNADPGEFNEEIQILRERMGNNERYKE